MKNLFLILSIYAAFATTSVWAGTDIVIHEIMYNSIGNDVEFIELYNASATQYNLQNWYILDDNDTHNPCVINWTLKPGEYLIIAGDVAQFKQKYPTVANVNSNGFDTGGTGWSLGNGGDVVRLFDTNKTLYDIVAYSDGGDWPTSPDGNGPSLELLHPALDNSLPTSWDPSKIDGGTPGAKNSVYTENVQPTCKDGSRSPDL
ncbi:MAG: lamin tail domain-containing protein, partial [bacterium]|nr:lamin tail domain-containing protein [bacterium]